MKKNIELFKQISSIITNLIVIAVSIIVIIHSLNNYKESNKLIEKNQHLIDSLMKDDEIKYPDCYSN